jgi:hypothetical protein
LKDVYLPAGSVPPLLHLTSWTPIECNFYFDISFATVMSGPVLYGLLTFLVRNLISIFLSLGLLPKESVKVRGPLWHFVTSSFLMWGVVKPTPNPQTGGTSLVGCPWLLIQ